MSTTFADLGVPAPVAQRLAERGIDAPFPIQAATIPDALAGLDVCGKAPTGSGKTIAFGVPMVASVTRAAPKRPKGLVLTPTRELANQVADEIRSLSGDLRVLAVYGGAGIEPQLKKLRAGIDIVVACPGRLLDVIERKACDLRDVTFAVVDEADRMADMGFLPDVKRILDQTSDDRQTLLFSATLDGAIDALVKRYQHDPVIHEMADDETGDVVHHLWLSERPDRAQLTAEIIERVGPTVVFSRTRHGADRIAKQIGRLGVTGAPIHGGRSQGQRERALEKFHRGEVMALVATDVAARGIHVEGVACVIHYDIPADHKDYVHRSGRTGRAGNDGTVVALVPVAQRREAAKILRQAGVDTEPVDPTVQVLPEGHAAFRSASRRPSDRSSTDAPKRRPTHGSTSGRSRSDSGARGARQKREDPRFETSGPGESRNGRATPSESSKPSKPAGPSKASKPSGPSASESNRAARRRDRFGDLDSAERTARAKAKKERRPAASRGTVAPEGDRLDRAMADSGKVRPSGASRRKAKRDAQEAAGEEITRTKKRRSGKPRPAGDRRR